MGSPESVDSPPRIVGVGASAGGLAALEQFLEHCPPRMGLAYLVVQHLDPTKKTLLAELLQRVTAMPVHEARDGVRVAHDCVYIIPPNSELTVAGGMLHLQAPEEPHGMRLPINILFSSLAREFGDRAIAVVLSGMGSDGTLGLQAIRAVGGLAAVQDPTSAQFDGMPASAIAAGYADMIATPAELPARILAYLAHVAANSGPAVHNDRRAPAAAAGDALPSILGQLNNHTRHDFSQYKTSTLQRRIERRMAIHAIDTYRSYAAFLHDNPQEIDLLFKELLIGVTRFFRDGAIWEQLARVTLPELMRRRPADGKWRLWVIGCSTGEEAYSLAMLLVEALQQSPASPARSVQIFASDLSPEALAAARRGQYPPAIREHVSTARLARFFTLREGHYRITQELRDMVLFAQHDVALDPPFTKLDLISCRNLLIYFDTALQRRLLPVFHYSLVTGGALLLGTSETVGRWTELFRAVDSKLRIYRRIDAASGLVSDIVMSSFLPPSKSMKVPAVNPIPRSDPGDATLQTAADRMLLQNHAPPAVVVNGDGDIVYISGRTGKYLEPAAGKTNWNFHAMARQGLSEPLVPALRDVLMRDEPVQLHGLEVLGPEGSQRVDVTLQPLRESASLRGMVLIVFREVAKPVRSRRPRTGAAADLSSDALALQHSREEIQVLREETRASKEELQSANEELQSTNEELQSANEELTTSKEEMQSMNEELQTINAEMQNKLDDLALAQSDMKNLLNSTDIAMLFLDQELNVRRFTERASKIINLRDGDIGRPLSDLTSMLQYPGLHADAKETLRTLIFSEKHVATNDSRWFSVRIMPYRRLDNVVDGAVITFVDITAIKATEPGPPTHVA